MLTYVHGILCVNSITTYRSSKRLQTFVKNSNCLHMILWYTYPPPHGFITILVTSTWVDFCLPILKRKCDFILIDNPTFTHLKSNNHE